MPGGRLASARRRSHSQRGVQPRAHTTPQARSEPSLQSTATPHHAVSCGDADTQHPTLHESRSPPARARYAAHSTPSGAPGRACRPFAAARTIHAISLLGTCTGCALPPPGAMLMPSHAPPLATACQACMMEETCLHAAPAESSHHGSGGVGCLVRCERCAAGHPRPCECATHALRCHQRLATAPATVRSGSASLPLSRPCRSRTPLGRGASLRGLPP